MGIKLFRLHFLAVFLLALFLARGAEAQAPKDPFPLRSDKASEAAAKISVERTKADTSIGEDIARRYKVYKEKFPPHRWKDRANACANPDTVEHWKLDSMTMTAPWNLEKFLGCFEARPKPDIPITFEPCVPLFAFGPIRIEICIDPPPDWIVEKLGLDKILNCCATHKPMLEACGLDPDKRNEGFLLRHHWPENVSQINNFESASFDPTFERGNDAYRREPLLEFVRTTTTELATPLTPTGNYKTRKDAGLIKPLWEPKALDIWADNMKIGQSHWGGMLPGDQTYHAEAHVFASYVNTLGSLNNDDDAGEVGFKENCQCFYGTLDKMRLDGNKRRQIVNGWTELPYYFNYWRTYYRSNELDSVRYRAIAKFTSPAQHMCASYRAAKWPLPPYYYKDLESSVGIIPRLDPDLARICFRGGGDFFPITGQLIGHFSPMPAGAYIARRSFYLVGKEKTESGALLTPPERRIHKYSDNVDKMQRIFPIENPKMPVPSECFRGHEIPNWLQEGPPNWPKDLVRDALDIRPDIAGGMSPYDDMRFAYWNYRESCMCPYFGAIATLKVNGVHFCLGQIEDACRNKNNGDEEDPPGELGGYGGHADPPSHPILAPPLIDGIPFPFMPDFGVPGIYTLDDGSQCNLQGKGPGVDPKKNPNRWRPEDPESQRGLKCEGCEKRCH